MISTTNLLNDRLIEARKKAVIWHNTEKRKRLLKAESEADEILKLINTDNLNIQMLAFSMLYLGEGMKKKETALGNSDPLIVKFFVKCLKNIFNVDESKIACELHLRSDQDDIEMKKYWAHELSLPLGQFKKSSFDMRTKGKATFDNYKGVCVVRCGNVAIQRKLVYLSKKFCMQFIARD